jgi:predicted RNase H-like HicB family nuclease
MSYKFNILFQKDEHGYFVYCPELKGCHSQGDTFEEAKENIREAIELYIEAVELSEN